MTGGHSRSYSKKMIVVRDKSETAARKVRLFFCIPKTPGSARGSKKL